MFAVKAKGAMTETQSTPTTMPETIWPCCFSRLGPSATYEESTMTANQHQRAQHGGEDDDRHLHVGAGEFSEVASWRVSPYASAASSSTTYAPSRIRPVRRCPARRWAAPGAMADSNVQPSRPRRGERLGELSAPPSPPAVGAWAARNRKRGTASAFAAPGPSRRGRSGPARSAPARLARSPAGRRAVAVPRLGGVRGGVHSAMSRPRGRGAAACRPRPAVRPYGRRPNPLLVRFRALCPSERGARRFLPSGASTPSRLLTPAPSHAYLAETQGFYTP